MRVKEGTADSDAETLDLDWRSHGLPGKCGHPVSGRVISFFLFFFFCRGKRLYCPFQRIIET